MSADNGIYVLVTKRTRTQENGVIINDGKEHLVYRVAHVQAIDNFGWYQENQNYNLGAYMKETWGASEVYDNPDKAFSKAYELAKKQPVLEYGIQVIDAKDMIFYGDM